MLLHSSLCVVLWSDRSLVRLFHALQQILRNDNPISNLVDSSGDALQHSEIYKQLCYKHMVKHGKKIWLKKCQIITLPMSIISARVVPSRCSKRNPGVARGSPKGAASLDLGLGATWCDLESHGKPWKNHGKKHGKIMEHSGKAEFSSNGLVYGGFCLWAINWICWKTGKNTINNQNIGFNQLETIVFGFLIMFIHF